MKRCSAFLLVCCWVGGFGAARVFSQQPQVGRNALASEFVNEHLPNWLNIGGELRTRLEGFSGGGFRHDNDDLYLLTRVRLNLGIKPASWLKFQFQGQDAQVFGKNTKPGWTPV